MNIELTRNVWRKGLMVLVNLALLVGLAWSALPAAPVAAASDGYVQDVDAGGLHTCVLTSAGGVKCWGANTVGQIGDSTSGEDRYVPVNVTGLTSGVSAVVTGRSHTCALTTSGGVKCWGYNYYGQLGNSTNTSSNAPVDVTGLTSGVTAIAAGENHTCAVLDSGGVKCWGYNLTGQLGNGTGTNSNTPVNVCTDGPTCSTLLSGISAVTAGQNHTCALTTAGGVKCWGYNMEGQLGVGATSYQSLTPVNVCADASCTSSLSGVSAITAGLNHTCAIVGGGAKCWGKNDQGQIGDDSTANRPAPVNVSGLGSGVSFMNAGYQHTCAIASNAAKCWGDNAKGQLGNNSTTDSDIPVDVSGLSSGVNAVTGGDPHSCALLSDGLVKCWGGNLHGQLGDGNGGLTGDSLIPVKQLWLSTYAGAAVSQGMCGGYGPCYTGIQDAIDMATGYPYYATVNIGVQAGTYTGTVDLNKYATLTFDDGVTVNGGLIQSADSTLNAPAGTLSITGDFIRNTGAFTHSFGTLVFSGNAEQTLGGAIPTWFNNVTVNSGSTLSVTTEPAADGTIINNGTLKQRKAVSGTGDVVFLTISPAYYGVWINPEGNDMGETTVTIRGNQDCTDKPSLDGLVKRCFEITPTTPMTASISFWYTEAERNGQENSLMRIYHWNTAATPPQWEQEQGTYYRAGTGNAQVVRVTDVSKYSKFVIGSSGTPTAVKLSALAAVGGGWGFSVLLGVVAGFALTRRKR